jgi:hypothetical protein
MTATVGPSGGAAQLLNAVSAARLTTTVLFIRITEISPRRILQGSFSKSRTTDQCGGAALGCAGTWCQPLLHDAT